MAVSLRRILPSPARSILSMMAGTRSLLRSSVRRSRLLPPAHCRRGELPRPAIVGARRQPAGRTAGSGPAGCLANALAPAGSARLDGGMDPVELSDGRLVLRLPTEEDVDEITRACQDPELQ